MKIEIRTTTEPGMVQITTLDERWYYREGDQKLFPSITWIAGYYPKGIEFYKWLANKGWDESQAIKNAAGERGTRVHRAIEQLIRTGKVKMGDAFPIGEEYEVTELTVEEYEAVMSFKAWYLEAKPEFLSVEHTCFNEEDVYAGTIDFKAKIDGEVYIVDVKTSKSIWPSHELQLSAYRHTPQGAADKTAILQVGYKTKKGWKFTEVPDKYELFLAAKKIWWAENENVSPRQKDYPLEITIEEVLHAENK
jgi:hypothetical protein